MWMKQCLPPSSMHGSVLTVFGELANLVIAEQLGVALLLQRTHMALE